MLGKSFMYIMNIKVPNIYCIWNYIIFLIWPGYCFSGQMYLFSCYFNIFRINISFWFSFKAIYQLVIMFECSNYCTLGFPVRSNFLYNFKPELDPFLKIPLWNWKLSLGCDPLQVRPIPLLTNGGNIRTLLIDNKVFCQAFWSISLVLWRHIQDRYLHEMFFISHDRNIINLWISFAKVPCNNH